MLTSESTTERTFRPFLIVMPYLSRRELLATRAPSNGFVLRPAFRWRGFGGADLMWNAARSQAANSSDSVGGRLRPRPGQVSRRHEEVRGADARTCVSLSSRWSFDQRGLQCVVGPNLLLEEPNAVCDGPFERAVAH